MPRVNTPVPAFKHVRSGTAHPPVYGVIKTSEWYAQRITPRGPWWRRALSILRAASPVPHGAQSSPIGAVEAGSDNGEG